MSILLRIRIGVVVMLAAATLCATGASAAPPPAQAVTEHLIKAGDIRVHYLRAGSGETMIVLVHGWPQSAREWRRVVPILAERFTVVAPDLRGVGGTDAPAGGYDKATLAQDIHGLITALRPKRVVVVGHDIGGMVAYAYARLFPNGAAGVAILDVPLAGVGPWKQVRSDPRAWHFGFNIQQPLAEQLVSGREATFFGFFIRHLSTDPLTVSDADVAAFARAYTGPARLHAAFAFYRAFDADEAFNTQHQGPLATPLLLLGAQNSAAPLEPAIADGLKMLGATDVRIATVAASGHWLAEEQPAATAKAIADFVDTLGPAAAR